MNVNEGASGGTYKIFTDRLSKEFLHLCLDFNRMPEMLKDNLDHSVYVLFSQLSYRAAQERKKKLMNTGFGNIWIEQSSFQEVA